MTLTSPPAQKAGVSNPVAIDLFCGVGGMSLGFRSAGFYVAGGVDVDRVHVEAYNRNFGVGAAVNGDLSHISGEELRSLFIAPGQEVDVVFGGPPCQGFSVGGKRNADDPRNRLLMEFARLVLEIRPRAFLAENVAGLMSNGMVHHLEAFLKKLKAGGYRIVEPVLVLNAADFGVPQKRRRVFVLGHREDIAGPSYPSPGGRRVTVRQAIGDLPYGASWDEPLDTDVFSGRLGRPSRYVQRLHTTFGDPLAGAQPDGLSGLRRTKHSPSTIARFGKTPTGTADPVSRFFRLDAAGQAPTLRAGTDSSRGAHTAPRPIHFAEPRCITVREAARLHSYPDWFQFDETKWHGFRQIGNSVPPLLARAVATSLLEAISERQGE